MIGRLLGNRYLIQERIGEGGMAVVYRAQDQRLRREVAVKVLREPYASDPEFVRRFRQEAHAAASLSHPHVAAVYDVGSDGDVDYIVMELLPGRTLRDVLREQGPLPPERAVEIAIQVARALQHAHERGLIHRDIKPQNILFTPDEQVKVADFGIARAFGGSSATETGTILGSVHYMSPEQVAGEPVGPPSDVYSLGVVLYEMLTGQRPYEGASPFEIAQKHLQGGFPPPQQVRPEIPPALAAIVQKAMARLPSHRFASAREMEQALRGWQQGGGEATAATRILPPGRPEPSSTPEYRYAPPPEPMTARPWVWAVMVLVVLVSSVGLVVGIFAPDLFRWVGKEVWVPQVVGLPLLEAQARLLETGLRFRIERQEPNREFPPGYVIGQSPAPGSKIRADAEVSLVVSQGPPLVRVPQVKEMSLERAKELLLQAGLQVGRIEEREHESIPQGYVIDSSPPPNTTLEEGSPVDLLVSKGPSHSPSPPSQPEEQLAVAFAVLTSPDTQPDPDNPERRVVNVSITIPSTSAAQQISIIKSSPPDQGEEPVFVQWVEPGQTIVQQVESDGPMKVKVYVDGALQVERTF